MNVFTSPKLLAQSTTTPLFPIEISTMLCVIQRVSRASVHVGQQVVGQISQRVLVLVGVEQGESTSALI